MERRILLASASPRRREILQSLGLTFEVLPTDVDESSSEQNPEKLCELLAERKGLATLNRLRKERRDLSDLLIIASDTIVVASTAQNTDFDSTVRKNRFEILGKPKDREDAERMLSLLSGKTHRVMSGIFLWYHEKAALSHDVTEVVFDSLSPESIRRYLDSEEPFGKAGSYAIQGHASSFIREIHGDFFNVVGLPVHRMCTLFRETFPQEPPLI